MYCIFTIFTNFVRLAFTYLVTFYEEMLHTSFHYIYLTAVVNTFQHTKHMMHCCSLNHSPVYAVVNQGAGNTYRIKYHFTHLLSYTLNKLTLELMPIFVTRK